MSDVMISTSDLLGCKLANTLLLSWGTFIPILFFLRCCIHYAACENLLQECPKVIFEHLANQSINRSIIRSIKNIYIAPYVVNESEVPF